MEKKQLKNFVEDSWREILVTERERKRNGALKTINLSKRIRTGISHENTITTPIKSNKVVSISRNPSSYQADSPNQKKSENYQQTLQSQRGALLSDKLKLIEEQKNKEKEDFLYETENINKELSKYEQRYKKLETFHERLLWQKFLTGTLSRTAENKIHDKINRKNVRRKAFYEIKYLKVMQRILKCKENKEKHLRDVQRTIRKNLESKQKTQRENFMRIESERQEIIESTYNHLSRQRNVQVIYIS